MKSEEKATQFFFVGSLDRYSVDKKLMGWKRQIAVLCKWSFQNVLRHLWIIKYNLGFRV